MAEEKLKIQIDADASKAAEELQLMRNNLAKFESALKRASDPSEVNYLNRSIGLLKTQIATTTQSMGTMGNAVKGNTQAWLNWGRVIQDAPYGLNGIANNLTQVIPSVGALGLAFSGVIAAMTFAQIGFGNWTRGLTGATDEAKDAMGKLRESAAKELVAFQQLTMVASNANIPLQQRKQAVDELQSKYSAYLGNLSEESILAGNIGNAYEKVSAALKAKIALQAAEEKVIPVIKQQLAIGEELANQQKIIASVAGLTAKDFEEAQKFATATGKINPLNGLQAEAIGASKRIPELTREYKALEAQIKNMFTSMQPFIQASNGLNFEPEKEKKAIFDIVKFRQKMAKGFAESLLGTPEVQIPKEKPRKMQSGLPTSFDQWQKMLQDMQLKNIEKIREAKENDAAATQKEIEEQAGAYMSVLSPAIDTIFTSLANGESVIQSLGEMFKRLAIQIVATLAKTAALAGIISIISGGKINFADAFKFAGNFGGGIKPFADGGIVNKPTLGVFGEAGSEAIMPLAKLQSMLGAAAQIGGGMGNMMGNMTLSARFSGNDLVFFLQKANNSLGLIRGR